MNKTINFVRAKHIDSYQKLHFLLFLYQHPEMKGTSQEFAERLYFGDVPLLEKIIVELQKAGLLIEMDRCWQLSNEPIIRIRLKHLVSIFEHPLTRQKLLEQIRHDVPLSDHQISNSTFL